MTLGTVKLNDGNEVRCLVSSVGPEREPILCFQMPVMAFGTGTKWRGKVRLTIFLQ